MQPARPAGSLLSYLAYVPGPPGRYCFRDCDYFRDLLMKLDLGRRSEIHCSPGLLPTSACRLFATLRIFSKAVHLLAAVDHRNRLPAQHITRGREN